MKYFDIQRDIRITNKGGFMCQGCLIGKPLSTQSPKDIRYCVECQENIELDCAITAELTGRKSKYKPTTPLAKDIEEQKGVLSRTNSEDAHECQNLARTPTIDLGGRPRKAIPIDLIQGLSQEGLSVRQIAKELKDQEIEVSYRTISRVLSGERKPQLALKG